MFSLVSPKSVAFPVVAVVMYSMTLLFPPIYKALVPLEHEEPPLFDADKSPKSVVLPGEATATYSMTFKTEVPPV